MYHCIIHHCTVYRNANSVASGGGKAGGHCWLVRHDMWHRTPAGANTAAGTGHCIIHHCTMCRNANWVASGLGAGTGRHYWLVRHMSNHSILTLVHRRIAYLPTDRNVWKSSEAYTVHHLIPLQRVHTCGQVLSRDWQWVDNHTSKAPH